MFTHHRFTACAFAALVLAWGVRAEAAKDVGPQAYKDAKTGITVVVESDRQVISGIDGDGKLLWVDKIAALAPPNADAKASSHVTKLVNQQTALPGDPDADPSGDVDVDPAMVAKQAPPPTPGDWVRWLVRVDHAGPPAKAEDEVGLIELQTGKFTFVRVTPAAGKPMIEAVKYVEKSAVAENKPAIYHDGKNGITIYVESNKRRVAGIDADGKVLWHRSAEEIGFSGRKMGARYVNIDVTHVGPPAAPAVLADKGLKGGDYANINFEFGNSEHPEAHADSSGGVIDMRTGQYTETFFQTSSTLQ